MPFDLSLSLTNRRRVMLGPNVVTNGTFDTDIAGWTSFGSGGSSAWADGAMRLTVTAAGSGTFGRYRDIPVTSGKTYQFSILGRRVSGNATCRITLYDAVGFSAQIAVNTFTGTEYTPFSVQITPTTSSIRVYVNAVSGASVTQTFYDADDISLRMVGT